MKVRKIAKANADAAADRLVRQMIGSREGCPAYDQGCVFCSTALKLRRNWGIRYHWAGKARRELTLELFEQRLQAFPQEAK